MVLHKNRVIPRKAGGNIMKKIVLYTFFALLAFVFLAACTAIQAPELDIEESSGGYTDLLPKNAKGLIDAMSDIVIIDVSPVYDQGHLPGAINYILSDGSLDDAIPSLDKSKTYLVYCHSDSVSMLGAQKLVDAGFGMVYRLEGNYSAWVDAGYPVEK